MKIKEPRHISLDLTNYFNLSSVGTAAVVTRTVAITSIREFVVKIKARKMLKTTIDVTEEDIIQ